MKVEQFVKQIGADFYAGVPDSQLKALCNYLMHTYGIDRRHHIIAANEGNAAALAAGYFLSTSRVPVVYMQNSGEGNVINPVASLLNEHVYAIPVVFVIGWRGEPGVHDEPQHIYQGQVTLKLLDDMGIDSFVVGKDTTEDVLAEQMESFRKTLNEGKSVAFVIQKGALSYEVPVVYENRFEMNREEVIHHIIAVTGNEPVVSTTGKASRELFEAREANAQGHGCDFLTVGSMGHTSSIALAIAAQKPGTKVWCIDGDGAVLMHMGSMAVMGAMAPENLVHIVLNNCAHETVGGMPTVAERTDLIAAAKACGYPYVVSVESFETLDHELAAAKERNVLSLIEVKCAIGSRNDLGRPTTTAYENRESFMEHLRTLR